jgi:hypothetical protein
MMMQLYSSAWLILEYHDFAVTTASTVAEALKHISTDPYDVLLSDLHMPGAGDGLTVVSAMRHPNPKAVTMLLSSFPEMDGPPSPEACPYNPYHDSLSPASLLCCIDGNPQYVAAGNGRACR